jgi:hypothetical protein
MWPVCQSVIVLSWFRLLCFQVECICRIREILRSCTCWLLSLPQVKISLKRVAFSNWKKFSVQWQGSLTTFQKLLFPGGHEEVEGTCKQTYWWRRTVFSRIKINYVHIRNYLCFITVVWELLGHTLYRIREWYKSEHVLVVSSTLSYLLYL